MFTKEDYHNYFEQIAGLERLMIYHIYDTLPLIDDKMIRSQLEEVASDEKGHYAFIRSIFDGILFENDLDRRKFVREHMLGKARLQVAGQDVTAEGYCVDLSKAGACIEFDRKVQLDGDIELWIESFDGTPTQYYVGQMAWSAEINPNLQMGKIKFRAGVKFATSS